MRQSWLGAILARLPRRAALASAAAPFLLLALTPAFALPPGPGAGPTLGPSAPPTSQFLQSLGYMADQTSQVGMTGIQQQIWSIEDRLQSRQTASPRPLGFADDTPPGASVVDQAFGALGYSGEPGNQKSPIALKAPPPAAEPSRFSYGTWTQGFLDYEDRTGSYAGTDIGRNTTVGGVLAGADVTVQRVLSSSDAFVIGLVTGEADAEVINGDGSTARLHGPMLGAYSAYVNGAFSVDGTFKTDFFQLMEISASGVQPFGLNNYVLVGNVNYKQTFGNWWVEPTVGVNYTDTVWNGISKAFGMIDGTDLRVQGGARVGTGWDWAGIHFTDTLTMLAYDDVSIVGGTLTVALGVPLAPTDEGKMFGQVINKFEAQLNPNWLVSVEGEFRGRDDVYGIAGRLGVTYLFN